MANILWVTKNPPKIFIAAKDIAKNPKILEMLKIFSEFPANPAMMAPTIITDEIVDSNGVKIMGESNILNKLPTSASNLYAKNVFNFVSNLYDKENKKINLNLEDEIIEKTLIK